jgi:PAS domain S-box-containing protein
MRPATSEDKFRALLEAAPDAMVIVDDRGRIELVNAQAEQLFGYPRAKLVGQSVELLVPARARAAHAAHRHGFLKAPGTRPMGAGVELYARRSDGTEFPVEISLSPLVTEQGVLTISAIRDVTARKRAEAKFRALLESAPDGMVIVNQAGAIVLVNAQAERMFGYDRKELLGQPVEVLVPVQYRGAHVGHRRGYGTAAHARPMGAGLELYGAEGRHGVPRGDQPEPARDRGGDSGGERHPRHHRPEARRGRSAPGCCTSGRPTPRRTASRTSSWPRSRTSCGRR